VAIRESIDTAGRKALPKIKGKEVGIHVHNRGAEKYFIATVLDSRGLFAGCGLQLDDNLPVVHNASSENAVPPDQRTT